MPKILRIVNRFNVGGPTYNAGYLARYLPTEFETLLIGGKEAAGEASSLYMLEKLGIKPMVIPEMSREISLLNDYKVYRKIRKIIQEYQPDIVHTHASKAGFIGRIAAKKENVPLVFHTFHGHVFDGYFGKFKTTIYINIERYLAKRSTKIIAISPSQKEDLAQKFSIAPENKFEIIPLGFDLEKFQANNDKKRNTFRKKYGLNKDEIAIGIIGRLAPIKNHALFIDAIAELKKITQVPVRAFIIGDGTEKENIIKHIRAKHLAFAENKAPADIVFTSWEKNIENILPGLDIVALSSISEGTPVSLIEAQAAGIPVVSTNAGGTKDVITDNETGFIAESNATDFAQKLKILSENEALRKEMGNKGRTKVKEKFSYQILIKNITHLYKDLI